MPSNDDSKVGLAGIFAIIVFLYFGGAICVGLYDEVDTLGYVSHTQTVDMYMNGDWLQGENRTCIGIQGREASDSEPKIDTLFCPTDATSDSSHNLSVHFWGKISRPEAIPSSYAHQSSTPRFEWRCTRESDSFTCYALD
jgi:hypothetical protein